MRDTIRGWLKDEASLPKPANEEMLARNWERWLETAKNDADESLHVFARETRDDPAASALLRSVFGNSPFLSNCLITNQDFSRLLFENGPDAAYAAALAAVRDGATGDKESSGAIMKRLRVAKRRAALAIGIADISSVWRLRKITLALSDFAEAALQAACRRLLRAQDEIGNLALPDLKRPERGSGLLVLGMGKLGARELNYSSDVDLIVLYDQDSMPYTGSNELQPILSRLARDLIKIIGERTEHGYVFRMDLRLRPDPRSNPLIVSVRSTKKYYRDVGRNWERAAMIKARPVAGDIEAGRAFLESLESFVWRPYLDFAASRDIQAVKRQIDASHRRERSTLANHNVKLGRGGIREIEFFVQAQQLIWGGRNPALQVLGTLNALDALVSAGHITLRAATELRSAYKFYRRLEHRLQMVNDEQTHSLPMSEDGIANIATFMGFDSVDSLREALLGHMRIVEGWFAKLFEDKLATPETEHMVFAGDEDDPQILKDLAEMGYAKPRQVSEMIRGWLTDRHPAMRNDRARKLLGELVPMILLAFAASPNPDPALLRFDIFLSRLFGGISLFSLLTAHPELLDLVAEIMGTAPLLADQLTGNPSLLDSVLSRDFTDLDLPDDAGLDDEMIEVARRGLVRLFYARELTAPEMEAELAAKTHRTTNYQDLLDIVRRWANDRVFQIGVHILRGLLSPVEAGRPLADIADVCIGALMPAITAEFIAVHGRISGGKIAVVACGNLGSREMTVGSDLDLMFLYDKDPDAVQSDGGKPLAPSDYYARLCSRLISAVTPSTRRGKLYEVDMRLRPAGNSGPIACSLEAFVNYQRSSAWTWELQALTRARVIYAEGGLGVLFEETKKSVLTLPRAREKLAADIVGMRERIRREHSGGDAWSIKHRRGGLLDVEFIAQFLQLLHAADRPEILAGDTISVFEAAGVHELLEGDAVQELAEATRLWRNLQGILRLTVSEDTVGEDALAPVRAVIGQAGGGLVFGALVEAMEETATCTARHFESHLGAR